MNQILLNIASNIRNPLFFDQINVLGLQIFKYPFVPRKNCQKSTLVQCRRTKDDKNGAKYLKCENVSKQKYIKITT